MSSKPKVVVKFFSTKCFIALNSLCRGLIAFELMLKAYHVCSFIVQDKITISQGLRGRAKDVATMRHWRCTASYIIRHTSNIHGRFNLAGLCTKHKQMFYIPDFVQWDASAKKASCNDLHHICAASNSKIS